MRKNIVNENWELEEVLDLNDLCAVLYKYGSNDAGYVEAFDFDDCKMKDAYNNLVNQYQEANADDSVHIYLVKLPSTNQVLSLLNSALYNGNERVPEAIEAVNDLCNRADCETLCSWNGCLTEGKKKKKVCSSSYCGFTDPELNIRHFNQCMGTGGLQNPNSQHLVVGDVLPNAPVANTGSSDGASDTSSNSNGSSAGEGGAVGESLNEDKDFEIKIQDNENIEEDNEELDPPIDLEYFPNNMGINLSSVKSEKWTEQDDGQLKKVEIEFDPATPEEIEDQGGLNNGEEKPIEESLNDGIDLEYSDLSVDDGEHSHTFSSFTYTADVEEVIKALSLLSDKDEETVEADLDNLVDKYYNDLLDHFEDKAKEAGLNEYIENQADYDDHSWDEADAWYDTSWERESLTEAHLDYSTQKEKMRQLNNGTRKFNAAAASDEKLRFNRDVCQQEGYNIALKIVEDEMIRRGLISRKIQRNIHAYDYITTDPSYFNEVASKTYWNDKNNPDIFIRDYGNSIEDLLVLYIFAKAEGNLNTAKKLGEYIVEKFTVTQLELINFANALFQNTNISAVIEQQLNDRKASGANTSNSTAANVSSNGAVILDVDELSFGLCSLVNKYADAEPVINYCLSVTGTIRNLLMALIYAICLKKDAAFIEKLKRTIMINCSYSADLIKETIKDCLGNTDKLNEINELIDRARNLKTESLEEDMKSSCYDSYIDWAKDFADDEDKQAYIDDVKNNQVLSDNERAELLKLAENINEEVNLEEAKRYVKRYYVRPQNIFCSNKEDILKALLRVDGENCSVYSLKNLSDHDDVQELQPSDIIYYYDDGILYDKNHVKVMDYDLNVKHEEERKKFANVDAAPEAQVDDVYDDRLTDADLKDKEAVANFRAINQRQMK